LRADLQRLARDSGLLGFVQGRLGHRAEAQKALDQLAAASRQGYAPALYFAMVYTGLGDKDHACEWLDKAYEERFVRLAYFRQEQVWDALRDDPRYAKFLKRVGFPEP
jgi:hypothetical protein